MFCKLDVCDVLASLKLVDDGVVLAPRTLLRLQDLFLEFLVASLQTDDGPSIQGERCWCWQCGDQGCGGTLHPGRRTLPPHVSTGPGPQAVWDFIQRIMRQHGLTLLKQLDEGKAADVVRAGTRGGGGAICCLVPRLVAPWPVAEGVGCLVGLPPGTAVSSTPRLTLAAQPSPCSGPLWTATSRARWCPSAACPSSTPSATRPAA